jgi:hypothetical protein
MSSLNSDELRQLNTKVTNDIYNLKEMLGQGRGISSDKIDSDRKTSPNVGGSKFNSNQKRNADFAIQLMKRVVAKQQGGKSSQSGQRPSDKVTPRITESGRNDSFRVTKVIDDSDHEDVSDLLDRVKRRPEDTSSYNELLRKIMDYFNVDEETARDYRSFLKLQLEADRPELKFNDTEKIKVLAEQLKDKNSAQEALNRIDQSKWRSYKEEKKREAEERRKQFRENRNQRRRESTGSENEIKSERSEEEPIKERKPRAKTTRAAKSTKTTKTSKSKSKSSAQTGAARGSKEISETSEDDEDESDLESSESPQEKQSKNKYSSKSKNKHGYLQSEDMIFSSESEI